MIDPAAPVPSPRRAHGPWADLALHSIGWKAFQDLCSQVCEEVLRRPVEIYQEAQDGGQDAVFLLGSRPGASAPVGTVQCKHSVAPARKLLLSDLTGELEKVEQLVEAGQADTYVLMTSMGVDAPTAAAMRARLMVLGVRKPHILGKQYLVRAIRASARLRALVPQIYGLGDLSIILDERIVQQTRALLDQWLPRLERYVPTAAHRKAIGALEKHGIVLLLGNPSSGKSAIGAILSTIAAEDPRHTVMCVAGPGEFDRSWNPNDPGRFFWIDDAFGSNVVHEDHVRQWTSAFQRVTAAIKQGNRFLLTSRRHIYESARIRLGQRNLPVFADETAIVDVGALEPAEREQILYNHLHFGTQTKLWKRSVKVHLAAVAAVPGFLPGVAERLGNPAFTKKLEMTEAALVRFMREPREHLVETIEDLEGTLRAALVLVYVHQGAYDAKRADPEATRMVCELMDVTPLRLHEALRELKGSFLKVSTLAGGARWTFDHPTISDALGDILAARPDMVEALLRGAPLKTILGSFVCEGAPPIKDAVVVPAGLDEQTAARVSVCPDEMSSNWQLFSFLKEGANDRVFTRVLRADPAILRRKAWVFYRNGGDPKTKVLARAHRLGLLPGDIREEVARRLEADALAEFDLSFLDDEEIAALIPPRRLIALGVKVRSLTLPAAIGRIEEMAAEADLDDDADGNFVRYAHGVSELETLVGEDHETLELVEAVRDAIEAGVEGIGRRKSAAEEEGESTPDDWEFPSSPRRSFPAPVARSTGSVARSVFDDVDS